MTPAPYKKPTNRAADCPVAMVETPRKRLVAFGSATTVSVVELRKMPLIAVMVTTPGCTPVTRPAESTAAIVASDVSQCCTARVAVNGSVALTLTKEFWGAICNPTGPLCP